MQTVVLLPAGVSTRDVMAMVEVLHERLAPEMVWAAKAPGPVPGHDPPMSFHADVAFEDVTESPSLLLLPGGFGSLDMTADPGLLRALRRLTEPPTVVVATSTGSLPLAAAGRLHDLQVSGHWLSLSHLRDHGATPVDRGLVKEGRFITTSGAAQAESAARLAADHILFGPGADEPAPARTR